MKVQISTDALRLRLSVAEFRELRAGRHVTLASPLPGPAATVYDLAAGEGLAVTAAAQAWRQGGCIELRLPMEDVVVLEARLPCRDGLAYAVDTGAGRPIRLMVEVDVRDPEGRRAAAR